MKHLISIGLVFAFVIPANAELIPDATGKIILDTTSGLEWLALGETQERSYDDVNADLGPGGDFEGWMFATRQEVFDMFRSGGITTLPSAADNFFVVNSDLAADELAAIDILSKFGITLTNEDAFSSMGSTADPAPDFRDQPTHYEVQLAVWQSGGIFSQGHGDVFDSGAVGGFHVERAAWLVRPAVCPCDLIAMSDFKAPMGKKKKLGSTIPVKFTMSFDGVEITSQADLDLILEAAGCEKACPEILITDVTDPADEIGLELPEDLSNVGEGGDLGFCFRYSDGNWVYNLRLPEDIFFSGRTYMVEVEIGDCIFVLGNEFFQIK